MHKLSLLVFAVVLTGCNSTPKQTVPKGKLLPVYPLQYELNERATFADQGKALDAEAKRLQDRINNLEKRLAEHSKLLSVKSPSAANVASTSAAPEPAKVVAGPGPGPVASVPLKPKPLATAQQKANGSTATSPAAPVMAPSSPKAATGGKPAAPASSNVSAPLVLASSTPKGGKPAAPVSSNQSTPLVLAPGTPKVGKPVIPGTNVTTQVIATPRPAPKPAIKPIKPVEQWHVPAGSTLRTALEEWAKRAKWKVDWRQHDLNYQIQAPLKFTGSFEDAVTELFALYVNAPRQMEWCGSRPQSKIIVIEKKSKPGSGICQ